MAPWTDVYSTTQGGSYTVTDEIFKTTIARYVRMLGTQRDTPPDVGRGGRRDEQPAMQPATPGGYFLFDFMVLKD